MDFPTLAKVLKLPVQMCLRACSLCSAVGIYNVDLCKTISLQQGFLEGNDPLASKDDNFPPSLYSTVPPAETTDRIIDCSASFVAEDVLQSQGLCQFDPH